MHGWNKVCGPSFYHAAFNVASTLEHMVYIVNLESYPNNDRESSQMG